MSGERFPYYFPILDRSYAISSGQPQEEVLKYMAAADVFLNTSISEGIPGTLLEAMAEGLPVPASNVTGNRVVVRDGETGLLFPLKFLPPTACPCK
jgi:glycosyltransferase involved in cell wall biosynthesis